ncbi:hypothetical protein Ae201684P_020644 [Aphanomyces euteiches]|nr:hypothetical protein Ae201684P_020644 [Aphanomyces euteiches]
MYLHNLKPKIMHRNIKAEKVHLTASLSAKLSGFGSAREWSYTHTMTQKVGTIEWSAQNSFSTKITTKKSIFTPLGASSRTRHAGTALRQPPRHEQRLGDQYHHWRRSTDCRPQLPQALAKLVRACLQLDSEQSRVAEAAVGKLSAAKAKEPIPAANPASIDNVTSIPHQDFYKLGPLQSRFWLHPQDCVVSRQIPSSYMCTMLGHYRGDPVVVKTLDMNQGANIDVDRKYLVREISMMAKLEHPNIITFYGFTFTNANDLKCVTEFMAGAADFHGRCSRPSVPPWPISDARNIKASKVLLTPGLGAKLSGFGYARVWTPQETMTAAVGTMEWAAPELLRNEDYSTPADVYSFGVLLTELDTRLIPYTDVRQQSTVNDDTLMMQIVTGALRPTVLPTCPRPIQKLIQSCLAVNPAQRPRMEDVVAILEQEKLMTMGL